MLWVRPAAAWLLKVMAETHETSRKENALATSMKCIQMHFIKASTGTTGSDECVNES